jgi:ketosteroid isomerase-like protein
VGWPEHQVYEGIAGAERFLSDWSAAWDDWDVESEAVHDAGDKVVVLLRQRGRSKAAGMPVDMSFAMVWTLHEGKQTRMEMFSAPRPTPSKPRAWRSRRCPERTLSWFRR